MRLFIRAMLLAAALGAGCRNDDFRSYPYGGGYNNPEAKAWEAQHPK